MARYISRTDNDKAQSPIRISQDYPGFTMIYSRPGSERRRSDIGQRMGNRTLETTQHRPNRSEVICFFLRCFSPVTQDAFSYIVGVTCKCERPEFHIHNFQSMINEDVKTERFICGAISVPLTLRWATSPPALLRTRDLTNSCFMTPASTKELPVFGPVAFHSCDNVVGSNNREAFEIWFRVSGVLGSEWLKVWKLRVHFILFISLSESQRVF